MSRCRVGSYIQFRKTWTQEQRRSEEASWSHQFTMSLTCSSSTNSKASKSPSLPPCCPPGAPWNWALAKGFLEAGWSCFKSQIPGAEGWSPLSWRKTQGVAVPLRDTSPVGNSPWDVFSFVKVSNAYFFDRKDLGEVPMTSPYWHWSALALWLMWAMRLPKVSATADHRGSHFPFAWGWLNPGDPCFSYSSGLVVVLP